MERMIDHDSYKISFAKRFILVFSPMCVNKDFWLVAKGYRTTKSTPFERVQKSQT